MRKFQKTRRDQMHRGSNPMKSFALIERLDARLMLCSYEAADNAVNGGVPWAMPAIAATIIETRGQLSNPSSPPEATDAVPLASTNPEPVRINAGGTAYLDPTGVLWSADQYFAGGVGDSSWTFDVVGTTADPLYLARRYGTFSYAIPVAAPGVYTVRLHVIEPKYTAAGQRVFSVSAEATTAIGGLDIAATSGFRSACVRSFEARVTDGTLNLAFIKQIDNPIVSGIEVIFGQPAEPPNPPSGSYTLNWTNLPSVPLGRSEGMGMTVNGKFYTFGGYVSAKPIVPTAQVHSYDPATGNWRRMSDMPEGLTHSGQAVDGQYVYLAGGYPPNARKTYQLYTSRFVRRYDTVTDTWTTIQPLPEARGTGAMVLLGRDLHFFGGADGLRKDRNEHWSLNLDDPDAQWIARAPMLTGRNHMGAAALNGKIYAIGGAIDQDAAETALASVEVYDPATNSWSRGPSLPTPRALIASGVAVQGGRIVVAGGETRFNQPTNQVTILDPTTNAWKQVKVLPGARSSGIIGDAGNTLIFATGFNYNAPNRYTYTAWRGTFT